MNKIRELFLLLERYNRKMYYFLSMEFILLDMSYVLKDTKRGRF